MKRQAILTKSVGTKVSEAELALLEARAKSTGLTLSTWVRRSLLAVPVDKLVYVNDVIKGKLMESDTLWQQAVSNSKEQFANSPDLNHELINAIMDASSALSSLSKQALESEQIRSGLKEVLLGPAQLYEALRARDSAAATK